MDAECDLTEHKFWPTLGADKTWQGTIVVMCGSVQQAEQLMHALNGRAVMINGQRTAIQAFNAGAAARGGSRGALGGLRPPRAVS